MFNRHICVKKIWRDLRFMTCSNTFELSTHARLTKYGSNERSWFVRCICVLKLWGNYFVSFPKSFQLFPRHFHWDILQFLQLPATFLLGCLSRHIHHSFFPCLHNFSDLYLSRNYAIPTFLRFIQLPPSCSNRWQAKFLTSHHVRTHRVIFYISNTLRKLMIKA